MVSGEGAGVAYLGAHDGRAEARQAGEHSGGRVSHCAQRCRKRSELNQNDEVVPARFCSVTRCRIVTRTARQEDGCRWLLLGWDGREEVFVERGGGVRKGKRGGIVRWSGSWQGRSWRWEVYIGMTPTKITNLGLDNNREGRGQMDALEKMPRCIPTFSFFSDRDRMAAVRPRALARCLQSWSPRSWAHWSCTSVETLRFIPINRGGLCLWIPGSASQAALAMNHQGG